MSATMSVLVGQVTELLSMCEALLAVTALSRIVLIVLQVAFFEVVLVVWDQGRQHMEVGITSLLLGVFFCQFLVLSDQRRQSPRTASFSNSCPTFFLGRGSGCGG